MHLQRRLKNPRLQHRALEFEPTVLTLSEKFILWRHNPTDVTETKTSGNDSHQLSSQRCHTLNVAVLEATQKSDFRIPVYIGLLLINDEVGLTDLLAMHCKCKCCRAY